jgi:hypothetical protein
MIHTSYIDEFVCNKSNKGESIGNCCDVVAIII